MKAAVYRRYGPPEAVGIEEIEKPVPKRNEVLVKVLAASVNPLDWHCVRGKPSIMRLGALRKPKNIRLGCDVSGEVEAAGENVTEFKAGDRVFGGGLGIGAFAEYVCAPESTFVLKPDNVSFEEAAAVPVAAFTALQGLRDKGNLKSGQDVLINGAAGGVGTLSVQIAKTFGAEVTGVCSAKNLELIRSLGADHAVDYTREDFTRSGQTYDLILDCAGNRSLSEYRRALRANGICAIVTGPNGPVLGPLGRFVGALAMSAFVGQKLVPVIANPNKKDLSVIGELMASEKIHAVIDRCYGLSTIAEAISYVEQGHARGKVVINVPH